MTRAIRSAHRLRARDQALQNLAAGDRGASVSALDEGQLWVLFAFVQLFQWLAPVPLLQRVVLSLACHCGMDLRLGMLPQVLQSSTSTLTRMRNHSPQDLLAELRARRSGPAKLRPEHAGPIARFLFEHPGIDTRTVRTFIHDQLGVTIQRHTLARFVHRYGLGCLQQDRVQAPPFRPAPPPMAGPSC